jgi:hypothetical protein
MMHVARVGFYVRGTDPNMPELVKVEAERISRLAVHDTLASVLAPGVTLPAEP